MAPNFHRIVAKTNAKLPEIFKIGAFFATCKKGAITVKKLQKPKKIRRNVTFFGSFGAFCRRVVET